ncbi:DUF835 domain-containing protein [Thermococcus camini]|uniref:DUF835 domain-containing protein n=1 Tax=Thermococcus camini TaxID=2016373 RepID=UPI003743A941
MRLLDGIQALLLVEAALVLIADAVAATWIFRIYLRNRRKSALAFSIAWVFDFLTILFTMQQSVTIQLAGLLCLSTFAGFIFYGSVKFLEEESINARHRTLTILSVMPVAFMVYMLGVYFYTGDASWTATSAAALGISGVFVVAGGLLLMGVEEIYKSAIRYLSISILLFGVHLVPAALFGLYSWYEAIGFTFSSILIVFMVWAMVKLTSSKTFMPSKETAPQQPDLKPGTLLVGINEYKKLKEKLRDMPVLAFVRDVSDIPEGWECYFVTTIPFQGTFKNTINPTNLARMTEIAYQYLETFAKSGKHGIIVIDCFEYLTVYNSWDSLMKFISKLRDFTIVNNGTLVVVLEKESLEPRLYFQLRKLTE